LPSKELVVLAVVTVEFAGEPVLLRVDGLQVDQHSGEARAGEVIIRDRWRLRCCHCVRAAAAARASNRAAASAGAAAAAAEAAEELRGLIQVQQQGLPLVRQKLLRGKGIGNRRQARPVTGKRCCGKARAGGITRIARAADPEESESALHEQRRGGAGQQPPSQPRCSRPAMMRPMG
jgi:hypothetical protein